jgi:hypothetical protein
MAPPSQVTLEIVSTSQKIAAGQSTPTPPKITMNGQPFPLPPPVTSFATGFQVVTMNSFGDFTDPSNILTNQYIPLVPDANGAWWDTWQNWLDYVVLTALTYGNVEMMLLILASYGMDNNMAPTAEFLHFAFDYGAGPLIQKWEQSADYGSGGGDWTSYPANYILVGFNSYGYGQGYEAYQTQYPGPIQTQLSVTLQNNVPPS